ncbi:4-nitrophenylphosphatase [Rhodotorula toruloides]|nr:4-nitrophenylphosphatase [Rhodotorula toruloides]
MLVDPSLPPTIQRSAIPLKEPLHYKKVLDQYDTWLFDCDGVIWTGPAGDTLTPNIGEAIAYLRSLGKGVAFVTNNATRSRRQYQEKFAGFGIDVSIDEIFTCGSATAEYLRANVLPSIPDEAKRNVYLIGQKAMEEEFESEGLKWKGGTDPEDDVLLEPQDFTPIKPDPSIGVVCYAFQMRINYCQLAKAYCYLSANEGCKLILTNDDESFLLPAGGFAPGEGAIARVLFGALPRSYKPEIVGKPHHPLLEVVRRETKFDPKRTVLVGDRLETDVLFAKRGEIDSILVWTGISKPENLLGLHRDQHPEYTMSHVGAILDARQADKLPN